MEKLATNKEESTFQLEKDVKIDVTYTFPKFEEREDSAENKSESHSHIFHFVTDSDDDVILHWGIAYKNKDWQAPSEELYPENTKSFNNMAVQTHFTEKSIFIKLTTDDKNKPKSLNFVFNLPKKNKWFNNENKDYVISIKYPTQHKNKNIPDFIEDIINCEVNYGSWTLMHRYNKCYDILNSLDIKNSDNLIWVYIWLRYSYIRQLDWQRRFNTKPRELAYSMSRLTGDITNKICYLYGEAADNDRIEIKPVVLLKMALSTLGKGTGDGQKIRDEILQIMHKNKIKETNDHFYEQWHQKLHNNTTPDDIVICEALLAYLKSGGQMDTYWSVLKVGGVTRDRLANFERKITNEPHYMPQLIPDFEAFLYTLKAVHSTNDLSIMFESAKYAINNNSGFYEIIRYKNDWDTLKQIWRVTDGREALNKLIHSNLKDSGKVRDLLFYDICLESYLRQLVEKIIHINLDFDQYVNEITAILKNLVVSYDLNEIKICLDDWINIAEKIKSNIKNHNNYSVYSVLKIKSITDRLSRILSHIVDYFNNHFDNKGRYLGTGFNCDKFVVDIFTEEVIRGTIFFTLSMILKKVEPILRKTANLGAWLIISRGKTIEAGKEIFGGSVGYSKTLQDVQFKSYDKPTVLLTEQVGGNEEIPPNVSCLIIIYSRDYPDILAHVSVRARNLGVPFMVCFDDTIAENLKKLVGQNIKMKINNQNVEILDGSNINKNSEPSVEDGVEENTKKVQAVRLEDGFPSIYLELDEFSKKYLGAKSNNTKVVFGKLPEWVKYPESFAIPFNVCEYYLDLEENSKVKSEIEVKLNF